MSDNHAERWDIEHGVSHLVDVLSRMAAKEEEKVDPNKDDDELDALLDSALEDFDKLSSPCETTAPSVGKSVSENSSKATPAVNDFKEPSLDDLGFSESDIEAAAAEFEKSMKTILGDDEELLKQWNDFAGKAAACTPGAENGRNEPLPEDVEAFEAHLLKTMKDMAENAKDATNSPEIDENFLKAMADMGVDGKDPDLSSGIVPMMQGMMMNLLSKDVLYPALDELRTKYPSWLEKKKSVLKSDSYENYSQQYKLVCEICSEYDKESKHDSDGTKKKRFERLMELMHKMQKYGQPPQELIGDKVPPGAGMGGNAAEGFSPDKCPVM